MKTSFLMVVAVIFVASAFASSVEVDKVNHCVKLEVVSTDPGVAAPIEFFLAGPGSDHDYESLFLTVASVDEVAKAFDEAGFPRGKSIDYGVCRFWPVGSKIEVEPDLWTLVKETRGEPRDGVVFTGGKRDADGKLLAAVESPNAIFALYDCPQSLIVFDSSLPQGETYGRFLPASAIPAGEKRVIKFTWKGEMPAEMLELRLMPENLGEALRYLKEKAIISEVELTPDFDANLTVAQAGEIAAALAIIDSKMVKINSYKTGQFYYRAFLPLEQWRDRTERLTQPYEVRIAPDVSPILTVIDEDWSDVEGSEPKLIVREGVEFSSIGYDGDRTDTCLIFAPKSTKLADVYKVKGLMPKNVINYYIYGE